MDTETNILAEPGPNRALPMWAINTLSKGVSGFKPDPRKVWGQYVRIAMSCRRRGWTEFQFLDEVWSKGTRHHGGRNVYGYWPLTAQLLASVKGSERRAHRTVDRAWATAGDNLLTEGTLTTTEEYIEEAIEHAQAWEERLDDGVDNLSVTQKLVMRYVTASVVKRRNSKVTCPSREVGAACGIPAPTANYSLHALQAKGLLVCHDRGMHAKDPKHWRSAIYSLAPITTPHADHKGHLTSSDGLVHRSGAEVAHRHVWEATPMYKSFPSMSGEEEQAVLTPSSPPPPTSGLRDLMRSRGLL